MRALLQINHINYLRFFGSFSKAFSLDWCLEIFFKRALIFCFNVFTTLFDIGSSFGSTPFDRFFLEMPLTFVHEIAIRLALLLIWVRLVLIRLFLLALIWFGLLLLLLLIWLFLRLIWLLLTLLLIVLLLILLISHETTPLSSAVTFDKDHHTSLS